MNETSTEKRAKILQCLVEGNSIRGTSRITGASKNTIVKLLADVGRACSKYHLENVRNLKSQRVQCDEIWSFCYAKQKNVPAEMQGKQGVGNVWTWTAIDADSKLIISWLVGNRERECAVAFMKDLRSRLANRVQLTTDGFTAYLQAQEQSFKWDVDFAMMHKVYGMDTGAKSTQTRYSPAKLKEIKVRTICGQPDRKHISTSFVERQNLTMRMSMRRFTRLTNAFSKKIENHEHAIALYFMYYNFCRVHQTLRVTPAMEAGIASHVWTLEKIVGLLN